jgi:cell division protein FtsI (penicillin-binding protein 3)
MRTLLRQVVTEGTGSAADVSGYEVGGKTGTSFKSVAGAYDRTRRVSSFFAGLPLSGSARYTLLVLIDEPHANAQSHGLTTAQWTAAPVAGRIIARIAPVLPTNRSSL